jgi:hypothetical protein
MASISLKYKSKSGNLTAPGDVDPGAMIPIATTTLTTTTSTVTFSSIPQSYEHLQIRSIQRQGAGGVEIGLMQFNSDTGSNYVRHRLIGDGSTASAGANTSQTSIAVGEAPAGTSTFGVVIIDILDYANTNKYKTIRALGGYDSNGSGEITLRSGLWMSTSAISSITITLSAQSYTQYSSFALYGIKRAGA